MLCAVCCVRRTCAHLLSWQPAGEARQGKARPAGEVIDLLWFIYIRYWNSLFAFACLPLSAAFVLWIGFVVLPIIAAVVVVVLLVYWWQLQLGVQLGHIYIRCALFSSRFFLPFLVKLQPAEVKEHPIGSILISIFTDLCKQFNWLAIIDISLQISISNLIDLQLSITSSVALNSTNWNWHLIIQNNSFNNHLNIFHSLAILYP